METTITRNGKHFKLQFLYLIARHGDRTPLRYLPDEPHTDYFPEGPGNLTNKGKRQAYNLGKILRKRYDTFLGDKYVPNNLYVRSTDTDRNLMSAECCVAGMFSPNEEQSFEKGLPWQPIPVHTKPSAQDEFNTPLSPTLQKPIRGLYYNPMHEKFYKTLEKNQDLLDTVNVLCKCNDIFLLQLVSLETYLIMNQHNLALPNEFSGRIQDMSQLFLSALWLLSIYTKEIYISAVNLLKDILEDVQKLIATEQTSTKTKLYSMSDTNIIGLLYGLTNEIKKCPSGSCAMLEFYKCKENPSEFCVKIVYLNNHEKSPLEMKMCGQKVEEAACDFENFKTIAENYINQL